MLRSTLLLLMASLPALADGARPIPPIDPHAPTTTHRVEKIPNGMLLKDADNPYYFARRIDSGKYSCSAFDIGCGFLITAAHCDTKDAVVMTGVDGDTRVGKITATYTVPGWAVPKKSDDWVNGENGNNDIKLVRVDYTEAAEKGIVVKGAPERLDWNSKPVAIDPKNPEIGFLAGYGAVDAEYNAKEKKWVPKGTDGRLAAGRVPFSYAGYFAGNYNADETARSFGPSRPNSGNQICSEPTDGLQSVINGDSGGPLLRANGKFAGINSSFWRSRPADAKTPSLPNYVSCFVDLAGHLPWIYQTMKPHCSTLPVVAAFDKAPARPGTLEGAPVTPPRPIAQGPGPGFLEPPVAVLPPTLPRADIPRFLPPAAPPREEPKGFTHTTLPRPDYNERKAPTAEDHARRATDILVAFGRQQADGKRDRPLTLQPPQMSAATRDQLRGAIAGLIGLGADQQVGFAPTGKLTSTAIEIPFGFCPSGREVRDCPYKQVGTVYVKNGSVEIRWTSDRRPIVVKTD